MTIEKESNFENKSANMCNLINTEDMEKIQLLRELVKNDLTKYYDTDFNILRWIQGNRDLPLNQVAKKFRAHLKMRFKIIFKKKIKKFRKSSWDLDYLAHKARKHPIHSHWMYGITGQSQVLPNVIVNIEQVCFF